jgi:uncharacterized protein (DUF1499 family)
MASSATQSGTKPEISKAAAIGYWLGLLGVLVLLIAGPGYKWHLWSLKIGLLFMIPAALFLGLAAIILSLIGVFRSQSKSRGLLGLILGLVAAGLPASNINTAAHSPIHDVSTDTSNPPQYVAVMPARNSVQHGNSTTYDDKTAKTQREIYPDITPVNLDVPPAQAFDRALAAARGFGWEIVASDPTQGRIEATATTLWFGFKDDVVIRITPQGSGSRVDVRSLSRIGESDVGANAKRIRTYVSKLKAS